MIRRSSTLGVPPQGTSDGAMLGASAAFGLLRFLGRPFVQRVLSSRHQQQLAVWSRERGGAALLIGRLIPVIAFNLINYAAALNPTLIGLPYYDQEVLAVALTLFVAVPITPHRGTDEIKLFAEIGAAATHHQVQIEPGPLP